MKEYWEDGLPEKTFFKIPESFNGIETHIETAIVGNKKITLIKFEGKFYACAPYCPHAGGVLSGGRIDAKGNIVCPLHGYRFSIKNGRNSSGEGFHLKTYEIEETDGGFFIKIG